jgi:hypothetical protein
VLQAYTQSPKKSVRHCSHETGSIKQPTLLHSMNEEDLGHQIEFVNGFTHDNDPLV